MRMHHFGLLGLVEVLVFLGVVAGIFAFLVDRREPNGPGRFRELEDRVEKLEKK